MLPDAVIARAVRILLCASTLALVFVATPRLGAQGAPQAGPAPAAPNYELASQWTSQKVSKLVFDTSVTPRWLETSDRFWYSLPDARGPPLLPRGSAEEGEGPALRSREDGGGADLDHAHPYDAQNLPFTHRQLREEGRGVRVQFPGACHARHQLDQADARSRPISSRPHAAADRRTKTRSRETSQGQQGQRGAGAAGAAPRQRRLATRRSTSSTTWPPARVALLEDYKVDPRPPRWASLSPDNKTVLFARNHNLYMMDAENYAKAQKNAERHDHRRDAADDGRRGALRLREPQRRPRHQEDSSSNSSSNSSSSRTRISSSRNSAKRETRRTPACAPVNVTWSRDSSKFALVRRDVRQGQGSLGHQPAREPAADARDLSLRDAGRGEHRRKPKSASSTSQTKGACRSRPIASRIRPS